MNRNGTVIASFEEFFFLCAVQFVRRPNAVEEEAYFFFSARCMNKTLSNLSELSGCLVAQWLTERAADREVRGSSPSVVKKLV